MTSIHVLKLRGNISCVFSFFSDVLKVSNFQTLENSSAVYYLTNHHALSWEPRAWGTVPRSSQPQREVCWYLNSQLCAKCLEIRMNRKLLQFTTQEMCDELKQKWQMPGVCQVEREGQGHPCRGNSMGKGMEPCVPTMHAGRSTWFGDKAWEKAEGGHERNLDLILSAGGDEKNMLIFSNS